MKNTQLTILAFLAIGSIALSSCKKKDNNTDSPKPNNTGNSLLSGAQTGTLFTTGGVKDFALASSGNTVVLIAANDATGEAYAIDIKDNNSADAAANTISGDVPNVASQIAAQMGVSLNNLAIPNMEVNPVSKAVYMLALNRQNNATALFKITNAGNTITKVSFTDVTYSAIKFSSAGHKVNDITWGDNTLYISMNQATTLNGELTTVKAPFVHNTTTVNRATTVFKTNWGSQFYTDAPLESMVYGEVDGEKRLMGLTVCAPGYSFKTGDIASGTGLLQVNEYFNLAGGAPIKVFTATQSGTTYLVELHEDGRIVRVGEKYINGSQTQFNASAKYLLQFGTGARATGLTDEDVKVLSPGGNHVIMAKYSDNKVLVIKTAGGALGLLDI